MSVSTSNERGKGVVGDRPGQTETQRKQNTEQNFPTQGYAEDGGRAEEQALIRAWTLEGQAGPESTRNHSVRANKSPLLFLVAWMARWMAGWSLQRLRFAHPVAGVFGRLKSRHAGLTKLSPTQFSWFCMRPLSGSSALALLFWVAPWICFTIFGDARSRMTESDIVSVSRYRQQESSVSDDGIKCKLNTIIIMITVQAAVLHATARYLFLAFHN
ncbi:hypothetical protein PVAR5_5160 [Paecilomyces variotii No. 5]|uniref:Uncharacterized protein n=1 Tax=Byssochlamys spectabilis (strain No. 5 / NBRC 109023) TaxID=1356009 RepID=V5FFW5_BYSSN|nr:hypothetical protein PVAR5_5160 [Paecilomyces variotii No. 5]